jgi:hypothetical protein
MPSQIINWWHGENAEFVKCGRDIVKNNAPISAAIFVVHTNEKWLPQVLTDCGFFPSNSEVKRNRKDLWREVASGREKITLSWAEITVCFHGENTEVESESPRTN